MQTNIGLTLDNTDVEKKMYEVYCSFLDESLVELKDENKEQTQRLLLSFCNNLTKIEEMIDDLLNLEEANNIPMDLHELYFENGVYLETDRAKFASICDELSILSLNFQDSLKSAIKEDNSREIEKSFIEGIENRYLELLQIPKVELAISC